MKCYWSEQKARAVVEAWRASGLSADRFASGRGISAKRLYRWKWKLQGGRSARAQAKPPLALLPVEVRQDSSPVRGQPISVLLGTGQVLSVDRGFDEETFARVVALLEGT